MRLHFLAPLGAALLLAGCASDNMVVVLPAADGHIGGVVVEACNKQVVLDKAYAEESSDCRAGTAAPEDVTKTFAEVLAARPIPPKPYKLYFVYKTDNLTKDSSDQLQNVFAEIAKRGVAEIVITGHTDPVGSDKENDELSLNRAQTVERIFKDLEGKQNPPPDLNIQIAGRGKRDASIPSGINCKDSELPVCQEARNVDITVQ
jgi:outer membrane protein OmpA-like peptidoglycan-associated protein